MKMKVGRCHAYWYEFLNKSSFLGRDEEGMKKAREGFQDELVESEDKVDDEVMEMEKLVETEAEPNKEEDEVLDMTKYS